MVGTAQADNFSIFVRKVGYSVGLESLPQRAARFGQKYAAIPVFRESDWNALVSEEWKLKSPRHVADVFGALGIAQLRNGEIFAGTIGEALGIAYKLSPNETHFHKAVRFLVALAIVRADGDIFLNALNRLFKQEQLAADLIAMVDHKRQVLFKEFHSTRARDAIVRRVAIERQTSNKGGGSAGGLAAVARGSPLRERIQGLGLPEDTDVNHVTEPSPDYLRKICVSRGGWSDALGLSKKSELTEAGLKFLSTLGGHGLATTNGIYLVWPTTFEVASNRFELSSLKSLPLPTTWQQFSSVFQAMGGEIDECPLGEIEVESSVQLIRRVFEAFRELAEHRSMIRNEISIHVVYATLLALALSNDSACVRLDSLFAADVLADFGIAVRSSQTIESAITVRHNARKPAR